MTYYRNFGQDNPAADFEELEAMREKEAREARQPVTIAARVIIYKTFDDATPEEAADWMGDFLSQSLLDADDYDCEKMEAE